MSRVVLDLCAGTGSWSAPYVKAGYDVRRVDLPEDVRLVQFPGTVHAILAAPPCTVFSYARNRYPPTDAEFLAALSVVDACLRIVTVCKPRWWAIENPVNKLRRYLGPPTMTFKQWEFGDAGHKPTALWGNFSLPMKCAGERTKPSTYKTSTANAHPRDAITPPRFAQAFFEGEPVTLPAPEDRPQ